MPLLLGTERPSLLSVRAMLSTLASGDSDQLDVIICAVVTWLIGAIFVALRLYTRRCIIRIWGWEDHTLILSLVFSGILSASQIDGKRLPLDAGYIPREWRWADVAAAALHGLGLHVNQVRASDLMIMQRAQWYGLVSYITSLTFAKISILLLYLSIFTTRYMRIAGRVLLAIVIAVSLWAFVCSITVCVPLQAYWDPSITTGKCWSAQVWLFNLTTHLATDYMIFLLPMPVILALQVRAKQKFALVSIFAMGFS